MIFREPTKSLCVAQAITRAGVTDSKALEAGTVAYRSRFVQSLAQTAEYNRYVPELPLYQDSLADGTTKIGMYAVFVLKDNKI